MAVVDPEEPMDVFSMFLNSVISVFLDQTPVKRPDSCLSS